MADIKQINDVIVKGIRKFTKPYGQPAENIQVVFKLDQDNKLQFVTCVNQQPKNSVTLQQLIGSNLYNMMVKSHIRELLERFGKQYPENKTEINLMAGVKAGDHVYVWLRKNNDLIRQLDPDDLK